MAKFHRRVVTHTLLPIFTFRQVHPPSILYTLRRLLMLSLAPSGGCTDAVQCPLVHSPPPPSFLPTRWSCFSGVRRRNAGTMARNPTSGCTKGRMLARGQACVVARGISNALAWQCGHVICADALRRIVRPFLHDHVIPEMLGTPGTPAGQTTRLPHQGCALLSWARRPLNI